MSRLSIKPQAWADARIGDFVEPFVRRVEATPPGMCPIAMQMGLLRTSATQTCGKCTPCYRGIPRMAALMRKFMAFEADETTLAELRAAATLLRDTADCAVGYQAGAQVLEGLDIFADEYESHMTRKVCAEGTRQTVPCVTLCPHT